MFLQIIALKNFAIFTGKHLYWSLFLFKLQDLEINGAVQHGLEVSTGLSESKLLLNGVFHPRLRLLHSGMRVTASANQVSKLLAAPKNKNLPSLGGQGDIIFRDKNSLVPPK